MPWDIENYHIVDGKVLNVEISIPLMEFLYTNIDDVKNAWTEMLGQFMSDEPGLEMYWEMRPRGENAIVTIRIGKPGDLEGFSESEAKEALDAVDALMDEQEIEREAEKKKKSTTKSKAKTKTKAKPKTKTPAKPKAKTKKTTSKKKK